MYRHFYSVGCPYQALTRRRKTLRNTISPRRRCFCRRISEWKVLKCCVAEVPLPLFNKYCTIVRVRVEVFCQDSLEDVLGSFMIMYGRNWVPPSRVRANYRRTSSPIGARNCLKAGIWVQIIECSVFCCACVSGGPRVVVSSKMRQANRG